MWFFHFFSRDMNQTKLSVTPSTEGIFMVFRNVEIFYKHIYDLIYDLGEIATIICLCEAGIPAWKAFNWSQAFQCPTPQGSLLYRKP